MLCMCHIHGYASGLPPGNGTVIRRAILRAEATKGRYTMNLLNLLMGSLGSDSSINALSSKTGVNASLLTKLLPLAIPVLLKALTKNASKEGGAQSLLTALGQHTNTRSITQQIDDVDEADGGKIVAHILGNDSDQIVSALAQETGMENAQVSRSLGALAPALMSMLSSSANTVHSSGVNLSDGFDLSDVMGMFGGAPQNQSYSMLGSLFGGGQPQQQSGGLLGSLLGGGQPQQQASPLGGLMGSLFGGQSAQADDGTELLSMLVNMMK